MNTEKVKSKLEQLSGCQAKIGGLELKYLLNQQDNFMPEDCAEITFSKDATLLVSTDMIRQPTLDLFDSGYIAVLHAISDIYATGGIPKWVLPTMVLKNDIPMKQASAIFDGVFQACRDENILILGGHTLYSQDTMIGITAIGHAGNKLITKQGAKIGDSIFISKPLGIGASIGGLKQGILNEIEVKDVLEVMKESNSKILPKLAEKGVTAATDITGYGLMGHLSEILEDNQGATIFVQNIPYFVSAEKAIKSLPIMLAERNNYKYTQDKHPIKGDFEKNRLLFDSQTNGGILMTVNPKYKDKFLNFGLTEIGIITETPNIYFKDNYYV